MEAILITCVIVVAFVIVLSFFKKGSSSTTPDKTQKQYHYTAKQQIMTKAEAVFYARLTQVLHGSILVIPQAHLSCFINHRVKGQNWRSAFARINGKSVDFLLCDKQTLSPILVIEIDDATHNQETRKARDREVSRILQDAKLPLLRFQNQNWANTQRIIDAIARVCPAVLRDSQ